jgi:hypothetical protein
MISMQRLAVVTGITALLVLIFVYLLGSFSPDWHLYAPAGLVMSIPLLRLAQRALLFALSMSAGIAFTGGATSLALWPCH